MSPRNVENPPSERQLVRTLKVAYPAGHRLPVHTHEWGQLAYAATGFLTVDAADATWVVPADRAAWLPPGTPHSLSTRVRTVLHSIYFPPGARGLGRQTCVVEVTPLVREIVDHVVAREQLDLRTAPDRRLLQVLVDQVRAIDVAPLELRQPSDERARDAAEQLRADPALDPDDVARAVGTSRRTLERRFREETGTPLGRWRQRAQVLRAVELLAGGAAVTEAATSVGYSTPSAFVVAFRTVFGTTPGRFFAN
jgi:AraC-like DNA-binding protein